MSQRSLAVYVKRWRIEVFFRTAKQDLAFEKCHSTSEAHHHAHFELLFATETLLALHYLELNKEKTSDEKATPTAKWFVASSTLVARFTRNHKGLNESP